MLPIRLRDTKDTAETTETLNRTVGALAKGR